MVFHSLKRIFFFSYFSKQNQIFHQTINNHKTLSIPFHIIGNNHPNPTRIDEIFFPALWQKPPENRMRMAPRNVSDANSNREIISPFSLPSAGLSNETLTFEPAK